MLFYTLKLNVSGYFCFLEAYIAEGYLSYHRMDILWYGGLIYARIALFLCDQELCGRGGNGNR